MAPYVGILRSAGLAKESVVGTLVTPPTTFIPYIPPDGFSPDISVLESKGVRAQPDVVVKATQGPATIKGGKVKFELEPENCGEVLMAALGVDTISEVATFVIGTGVNDRIDFAEDGGAEVNATLAAGTYAMGSSSAVVGSLCALIKAAMEAVNGTDTYTVTYSYSTKKLTITKSAGVFVIKFATGANTLTNAHAVIGFANTDTPSAIAATSGSVTTVAPFTHTFTRLSASQLPTYSWWFDKGAKYPQFAGCMLGKLDIEAKAKEFVTVDSEWTGLSYDDTGITHAASYSPLKPFTFNQVVVNVDGAPVNGYDNVKVSIDNKVNAEHALSGSIYPAKIWSEGMRVTLSADLFFEDSVQYAKFLAGTSAAFSIVLTSSEDVPGALSGTKAKLTIALPDMRYTAAPLINASGILKVPFAGVAVFDSGSSKTVSFALINSRPTAY